MTETLLNFKKKVKNEIEWYIKDMDYAKADFYRFSKQDFINLKNNLGV